MSHYIPSEPELKHLGGNTIGGNPQTFYPQLWAWMVKTLNIKTVLDVGCGEGHAMREFTRLGCEVNGLDGAPRNVVLAGPRARVHDLTIGPCIAPIPIDLVWCCEVVGQIEERYVDNVIKTLVQGKWLAMTNQLPGQPGPHNMFNCQPVVYWEKKLCASGFAPDCIRTNEAAIHSQHYWSRTGVIYRRVNP